MRRSLVVPRQHSLKMPEISNPFVCHRTLTVVDKIQVALMTLTIAPIRLILMFFFLVLAWLLVRIAVACKSKEDIAKPMSGWRLCIMVPLVALGRTIFVLMGLWVSVRPGSAPKATAQEAPVLVVAHHSALVDVFVAFFGGWHLPSPVSRAENAAVPLVGKLIEYSQPVLVKREDPNSRGNTVQEIKRRAQSGGQWPQIIIFPEGTCTNRTCLIAFKQGAFLPGVPVQPVCIKYPNKLDTVTWTWDGPSALRQLWLTLCQFYTKVEVMYLPIYHPNEDEKNDPRLYAYNVRAEMAKCLDCPVTDHTFEDCRLKNTALGMQMPGRVGLVEFQKLHTKIGLKYDQMCELLKKFKEIKGAKWREGVGITYDEFSEYLLLPQSDSLREVFDLYDRDRSGSIDFREYMIGLSLISDPVNDEGTIKFAFELFDDENKGYISLDDLQGILRREFGMNPEDVETMFHDIDTKHDNRITFEEFSEYAAKKPEYAKIFTTHREWKAARIAEEEQLGNGHHAVSMSSENSVKKVQ